MKEVILESKVVATDDTPLKVQAKKKTRTGRDWVYYDPIRRLAVFDYTPSRSRDGPMTFLGSFSGYLQADAYAGYDAIFAGKTVKEAAVLPKSPAGKAIRYVRANWAALNRYVEDGDLDIDNNAAERAMRHIAVGRKNWLFLGSDRGGETGAILTSLLYSAKLHRLDLWAYMKDVLERIADTRISQLDQFLPDVWKREHGDTSSSSET